VFGQDDVSGEFQIDGRRQHHHAASRPGPGG
jgi:hypothetical protein